MAVHVNHVLAGIRWTGMELFIVEETAASFPGQHHEEVRPRRRNPKASGQKGAVRPRLIDAMTVEIDVPFVTRTLGGEPSLPVRRTAKKPSRHCRVHWFRRPGRHNPRGGRRSAAEVPGDSPARWGAAPHSAVVRGDPRHRCALQSPAGGRWLTQTASRPLPSPRPASPATAPPKQPRWQTTTNNSTRVKARAPFPRGPGRTASRRRFQTRKNVFMGLRWDPDGDSPGSCGLVQTTHAVRLPREVRPAVRASCPGSDGSGSGGRSVRPGRPPVSGDFGPPLNLRDVLNLPTRRARVQLPQPSQPARDEQHPTAKPKRRRFVSCFIGSRDRWISRDHDAEVTNRIRTGINLRTAG